jgi:hypothetical protein
LVAAVIARNETIAHTATVVNASADKKFKQAEMTVGCSLKGFIFITAGQRPAEKLHNNGGCLKGRTPLHKFCLSGSRGADVPPQAALRLPAVMKIRSRKDKTVFAVSVIANAVEQSPKQQLRRRLQFAVTFGMRF